MRRVFLVVTAITAIGLLTRFALKPYSVELAHIVVVNALAQRIPDDLPRSTVYSAFSRCLQQVKDSQAEDRYMQQLLTLSHRLEKVQYLERREVEKLLEGLTCN